MKFYLRKVKHYYCANRKHIYTKNLCRIDIYMYYIGINFIFWR